MKVTFSISLWVSIVLGCFFVSSGIGQKITTNTKPPKTVVSVEPDFGESVKQYGSAGTVTVWTTIDKTGKATPVSAFGPASLCTDIDSPHVAAIRKAVTDAVSRTVFEGPLKDGKPAEVQVHLTYKFGTPDPITTPDGKPKMISGGVMNGRASKLPRPEYPVAAGTTGIGGQVTAKVVVSESGEVISAAAISGHPLLRDAAVRAACSAKFPPLLLQGNPIKVTGLLTYNFVR